MDVKSEVTFKNSRVILREESKDRSEVIVTGKIDETFVRDRIPAPRTAKTILDVEGVTEFNSMGVREWIRWIQGLSKSVLVIRRASVAAIDQMNMIPEAMGSGQVESFWAPYYCSCQDEESNILLQVSDHLESLSRSKAPEAICPKCGSRMEFDAVEESYFAFLRGSNLAKAS